MISPFAEPIRVGMVGGGSYSNIGETHRRALRLDGKYELVAGVFSRKAADSAELSRSLGIDLTRAYTDYMRMAEEESSRPDGVELVVVATPDSSHFDVAKSFLERGISVACEKPLTQDSESARELARIAQSNHAILAVAHCYSAYAMVRHAARMVREGELGELRFVDVEHASGWAATRLEDDGHPTVVWRMDPATSSYASAAADIGTHAFHLARFITGDTATKLSAELTTIVPGRKVADCMTASVHWQSGMRGRIWATMAATGHNHGLRIRVYGSKASIEWQHEDPHHLTVRTLEGETRTLSQGLPTLSEDAQRLTRTGLGHPEGFLEAFANYYSDIADDLLRRRQRSPIAPQELRYPTGVDGVAGVELVEAVIASHAANGAWTDLPPLDI